ncbi:hypothetical protein AB0O28_08630 [Microbispora sp. NPDC088329]|uniref:hypothetical protein n=1 Tax=Microbispora sp. NPDC088329 TaxID=3154869 RepID=UPI003421AB73
MTDFAGKVALVPGAGSGIGRASALEFAFDNAGVPSTSRQLTAMTCDEWDRVIRVNALCPAPTRTEMYGSVATLLT